MSEDFASAIQSALKAKEIPELPPRRIEGSSLFMSETRRRLFQYLTDMPAASLREIERAVKLSIPSVKWHIGLLKDSGLITEEPYKNLYMVYPSGLITSVEACILSSLRNRAVRGVMELIAASPGISSTALRDRLQTYSQRITLAAKELERLGLISSKKAGGRCLYFPEHELLSLMQSQEPRSDYLAWFMEWLENDQIAVRNVRKKDGYGFIEIELPESGLEEMRINLLPYRNFFSVRL